jgi:hypothetical protein
MDKSYPNTFEIGSLGARPNASFVTDADSLPTGKSGVIASVVPPSHDPAVIRLIYQVAVDRRVNDKVILVGFEAGLIESHMNNLDGGRLDSVGVFRQRPSMGWESRNSAETWRTRLTRSFLAQKLMTEEPDYTGG